MRKIKIVYNDLIDVWVASCDSGIEEFPGLTPEEALDELQNYYDNLDESIFSD